MKTQDKAFSLAAVYLISALTFGWISILFVDPRLFFIFMFLGCSSIYLMLKYSCPEWYETKEEEEEARRIDFKNKVPKMKIKSTVGPDGKYFKS
jgi:hypothetical protein